MAWRGGELTVAATATQLSAALGLSSDLSCSEIQFSALTGNAGTIWIGPSTVTATTNRRLQVQANTNGVKIGPTDRGCVALGEVYFIGTANDKLFVSVLER